jgi:hypothetical protein
MTVLNRKFNWGLQIEKDHPALYKQLSDMYEDVANAINNRANRVIAQTDPPAVGQVNTNYDLGDIWVNSSTNNAWIMTFRTNATAVNWQKIT